MGKSRIHRLQLLGLVESHTSLKKSIDLYQQALAYQEKLEKIDPLSRHKKADILTLIIVHHSKVMTLALSGGLLDISIIM